MSDFFQVYETQAIIRYIDRVLPRPPLTPGNPQAAGRMDQFMNINEWYLFKAAINVIGFQRVVGPRLMGLTPEREPLTAKHSNLRAWLNRMNARPSVVATTWECVAAMTCPSPEEASHAEA